MIPLTNQIRNCSFKQLTSGDFLNMADVTTFSYAMVDFQNVRTCFNSLIQTLQCLSIFQNGCSTGFDTLTVP